MKIAPLAAGVVATLAATAAALTLALGPARSQEPAGPRSKPEEEATVDVSQDDGLQAATFGGGCFWCTEAVFEQLNGVKSAVSGYAGGNVPFPSYKQVCTGLTGHAEVTQITYDPAVISYSELLEVFWKTHDPTTLNRQGPDVGTQYRSVIFTHDEEQDRLARTYKDKLNASGAFNAPIVTQIEPLNVFYPAEKYHQNYYRSNKFEGYCQYVIVPKLEKFRKVFKDKLKH